MLVLLTAVPAIAQPSARLLAGGQVGLIGWQRAGDHAALVGAQLFTGARGRRVGTTVELDGALARERNAGVQLVTWPLRASATLDVVVRRRDVAWVSGLGPGVSLQLSRLRAGDDTYASTTVRPVLRARTGLDGPLAGAVRWRVSTGVGVRPAGADWDLGVGLAVRP